MDYETEGSSALKPKNDGYIPGSDIRNTAPGLEVIRGGKSGTSQLHDAESAAARPDFKVLPGGKSENSANPEADAAEKNPGFANKFTGAAKDAAKIATAATPTGKVKAALKSKRGPLIFIVLLLLIGGGVLIGGQSLMPFAIANRLIEEFNSTNISMSHRNRMMFNKLAQKNKLSEKSIKKLNTAGVEVEDLGKPNGYVFTYTDSEGNEKKVVSNEAQKSNYGDATTLSAELDNAASEFRAKYTNASATWSRNYSGWYDTISTKMFKRLFGTAEPRNRFNDITPESTDEDILKDAKATRFAADGDLKTATKDDNNQTVEDKDSSASGTNDTKNKDAIAASLKNKATKAASGSGLACVGLKVGTILYSTVAVQQTLQMLTIASGYLEATQKVQAGDGNNSPLHFYNNRFTTNDANGKSAMSSAGIAVLFGGAKGNQYSSDTSVKKANTETSISSILSALKADGTTATTCNTTDIASAAVSLALFKSNPVGLAVSFAVGTAFSLAIATTIENVVPILAEMFVTDLTDDFIGEDVGNYLAAGGEKYLSSNHQQGGGSPGTAEKVAEFKTVQAAIIAEQADYDRDTLSPFNTSSQYTFLGSLLYSAYALSIANNSSTTSLIGQLASLTSNSIQSLTPSSSAINQTDLVQNQGDCPLLESVNAKGDMYCNPYYITDTDTLDWDPDELIANLAARSEIELDSDGNVKKVTGEGLKNYINFCGSRDSQFGLADANIAGVFQTSTGNTAGDAILDNIPIVSDIISIGDAINSNVNMPWITGEYCIANDTAGSYWDTNGKYYQRFVEDQRLIENITDEKSATKAIAAVTDEYLDTLDYSYEGILARFSGQTKDQVIAALDELEYYVDLADYNPTYLYPTPTVSINNFETYDFTSPDPTADQTLAKTPEQIVYSNPRAFATTTA